MAFVRPNTVAILLSLSACPSVDQSVHPGSPWIIFSIYNMSAWPARAQDQSGYLEIILVENAFNFIRFLALLTDI